MNREVIIDEKNNRILESILFNDKGEKHSEGIATHVVYSEDGRARVLEEYFFNGKLHNLTGYSIVVRNENNEFVEGFYFIDGKEISEEDFYNHKRVQNYKKTGDFFGRGIAGVDCRKEEFGFGYVKSFKGGF